MRIVIKKQKPISISSLIEGFPNNSEDFVLEAISNLCSLGYVSYPNNDKDHIIYNKDKRKEILTIIDPLPQLQIEKEELPAHNAEADLGASLNKRKNENKRYRYIYVKQSAVGKIALAICMLVFGIVSIFSTATSTEDVYQNFKVVGNYHLHKIDYFFDSYGIGMFDHATRNHGLYYSPYFQTGEFSNSNIFPQTRFCV